MASPPLHTEVVVPTRPLCDLCREQGRRVPASIDARLPRLGTWANVCEPHAEVERVRLGLGRGQRLIVDL